MNIGNVKKSKGGKSGKEVALSGADGGGAKCYNCGKPGHKAAQCPNKKDNDGKGKFTGKCNLCGKVGHKKADCWDLPDNADKRPKNYKPKNLASSGEAGGACVESLLGAVEMANSDDDAAGIYDVVLDTLPEWVVGSRIEEGFSVGDVLGASLGDGNATLPNSFELLKDPEIWIGDSGASRHSTFSSVAMYECKEAGPDDLITVGNGSSMKPEAVGKLKVTVCDKFGVKVNTAILQDVIYSKNARFNMFSITKCMKNGWKLHGDHESGLTIEKDDTKISCFDIKDKTKRGVLFCALLKRNQVDQEVGAVTTDDNKIRLGIKAAHDRLGHFDEEHTRATARLLNWSIVRALIIFCSFNNTPLQSMNITDCITIMLKQLTVLC
jgi:Arginine methyltransferase-interacting protein, contains RING Zn-finger